MRLTRRPLQPQPMRRAFQGGDQINPGRRGWEPGVPSRQRGVKDSGRAYRGAPLPCPHLLAGSGSESVFALRVALHKWLRARGRLVSALSYQPAWSPWRPARGCLVAGSPARTPPFPPRTRPRPPRKSRDLGGGVRGERRGSLASGCLGPKNGRRGDRHPAPRETGPLNLAVGVGVCDRSPGWVGHHVYE